MKFSNEAEKVTFLKSITDGIAGSVKTSTKKDVRKSAGDSDIATGETKVSITKYIRGITKDNWVNADDEKALYETAKALGQDDGTLGGVFVPEELSSEIIPLLKEESVIRQLPGVRSITLAGDKMKMNRVDAAPLVSWGSEAGTITEDTTLEFGDDSLELKKAQVLYLMSQELLMNANTSVDAIVRQEIAHAMGLEEDKVFFEGTGGVKPLGIYYHPRVVSTTISTTPDFDTFKSASYQVRLNQAEISGWVGHPRTANTLAQLKDGNGRYIFAEGSGQGVSALGMVQINGMPFVQTTQVSIVNRPASADSYIIGGRWSDFLIGEKPGLRIDTSEHRYFETDQVGMKVIRFVGSMLRQPGAFVVIKGVQA